MTSSSPPTLRLARLGAEAYDAAQVTQALPSDLGHFTLRA